MRNKGRRLLWSLLFGLVTTGISVPIGAKIGAQMKGVDPTSVISIEGTLFIFIGLSVLAWISLRSILPDD